MLEPAFSLPSLIEAERKHLLSQRKKAYSLIFLMIMLAQTSYIGALEGWSLHTELEEEHEEPLRVDSPTVCAATSRSSGTAIYVDVTEGDDAYPGTTNCPKASLGAAVTLATSEAASNPEIVLHAGLYHENVSINNLDNLLIRAADGDRVVFDGTRSISDDLGGVWGSADSDGIQEVTLTEDGWQLFLAHEEQVPARWPNAGFDDETVFNRSYWAEGILTNSNNAYTKGWLTDAGPEAGVHTGLNETVNASGLDPVGAIAVMNLGSFRSNSRIITDWNPNNGTFAYDADGVGWKTKHHAYFLEGKRELIDVDGEWWYNNTNNRLHYKTPSGQDANDLDLRVKVQPFAISVDGSDGVTIQGIDFFGTTVNFNNCDGCSFTNSTLEYPSTSKRGLGIAGESEDDRWMTRFYRSMNSFVDRISITNTDGGAIEFQGSPGQSNNNTVNNSYFHAIDWSAADQKGLMVTIYEGGRDMYFTNNSVHLTGASSVLSIGDAPKVFYNEVWDVGHLQTDGAVVQVMQGEAPGSIIAYNWIHDIIKYGARFDAPIGQAGEGRNGTMHHNVIWNAAGGLMVKGDYHDIHNNTVFNSTGKNDMIILTDGGVNNGNSTIHQNAADKMADHRSDSWSLYPLPAGTYWNNWNGYVNTTDSVWNQLVDPANRDFRPKVNSHLSNMSAGAYDAGVSNPWTAGISWTYTTPNAPVAGCMLDYADNYNAEATLSDGSCLFASYSPPSTLDLRLHLDPTNSSSYSGSGTDLVDLSTYGNDGTIDGAEWEANRTRFYYDGSCSGATAPPNQAGTYVCDEVTLAETNDHDPDANGDWSVSVWINATTVQHSVIIGKWNSGGSASDLGYIIRIGSDNKLYTSVGTTSGSSAVSTPRISIDEDHWYHLVMVADAGNILKLYADGVNVANASLLGSGSIRNTTSGISIGSYNAGEYNQPFDGNIGEVMIFADALNSTTINQMYKAGKGVYSNTTNLSYAQTSSTMLLGQTYSFPITATNGELTTSYSLTGTLPTGMNFESSNGTIWGTPTVAMTSTTYTLTANNSAGSYSTSISLTSQHVAPYDLVYSPENMMFTKGTAITPNFPSVSGGTVTSWEISPSLPTGLTWGTTDGKISGTPTVLQTIATTYTIWANNSGGSASIQVNITVNDEAPDISYSPDWFVLTNNTAMSPTVTPTNSGGAIPSAIIDSTGNIGQHTSIAIDSNGFKHISYFDYSNQDLEYATDKSGSWVTHSVETTGNVGYYTSIAVDSNDNVHISYFDNTNDDLKYATDKSGSWVTTSVDTSGHVGSWTSIAIDSNDAVHISYYDSTNDDLKYATCSSGCATASNWNDVSVRTAGNVGSWNSIAIDSTDAVHISYRDSTNNNLKYATCSSGCTSASNWNDVTVDTGNVGHYTSIAIDSNDAVHISYYDLAHKDLKYATCSSGCTTASNWNDVSVDTAGYVGSYTSIAIDSNDAVHISYRDSTIDDLKYATCSSGCTTASNWNDVAVDTDNVGHYTSIAIDSNDAVHISYYDLANDDLKYTALDSSSNILGYSVSPALPEGLEMNINTGEISGTPTALSTNTTYTITVGNSGGMNTTTITILVNDQVPNALGYTLENMTLEKGTAMTTNTPSVSGGAVTSWEIDPSLPSGLSFGSANGSIWGTPTILQTTTVAYTIWANNSGGSESAQVNITINDQIASISYTSPVDISNNRLLSTITPTTSGGAITSWEITPSLPTGLTFGTTNGSIWGTPENVTSNATYTIYANNSGGSASATLTLNVNWTLTPSADGAYITRNSSIGTDITWEWDYDPLESSNLTMYASWRNTCAIRDDGDVYCWGRNGNGQIGNGNMGSSQHKDRPTKTNNLGSDAISVSIGEQHTCAVLDTGVLKCWGRNNNGQIGNGGGGDVSSPTNVNLGSGRTATSVYLGFHHTCAILDDQSVKCWGRNQDGELGVGSTTNSFNTPQSINSLGTNRHAVSLALGEGFTCALLDDGSVKCWGQDNEGQRGDGGLYGSDIRSPPSSAISLPAGRTATQISAGQFHVCALLDDASVVCWGKNANGQLGDGSTTDRQAPVATSSFGSGHSVSYISAGYDHTCALLTDGGVRCWGSNGNGQLGDGSTTDRSTPSSTDINLGSGYTSIGISAGGGHTCAMLNDGDMKCWGASGSGQLGNNAGLNGGDETSPVFIQGTRVWEEGDFLTSPDVIGATCAISPALPTGMSLTSGTCAITGKPTVTAVNATYTVWANISGQSFSGQVWLEVGLNAPILSYSPTSYTYTKDSAISPVIPTNTGGEIASWELGGGLLPAGLNFGTSNGTFWGTPTAVVSASTYTVWANNSAGSDSFSITFTVNDVAPSITFTPSTLNLVTGSTMTSVTASNSGGSIVSCSVSPSLPSGLSLSSSCVLSGTPTVASSTASYTITATNTGGSDTASISLTVQADGGSLTITPANREGSVNSAIANITMSYTHTASNYGWSSGVTNTTNTVANLLRRGHDDHLLEIAYGEQDEIAIVFARNDNNASNTKHSLALAYKWNGTWTETIIDNNTDTGQHPSVAIDRNGAVHIAYIDYTSNPDVLRYATNATGTWVLTTLGNSTYDNDGGRGTAIVVHPITDAVHIVATINDNTYRDLIHYTNETGSWVNTTITNTSLDAGHDPSMAMDGEGNLYVAYYCDDGCSDLMLARRVNGFWENETVAGNVASSGSNYNVGNNPDIVIDSQGTIHIVSIKKNQNHVYLHSGTPGSWSETTFTNGGSYWPTVDVDSKDVIHIAYRKQSSADLMYITNASGSWSTPTVIEGGDGGYGSDMVVNHNDDIFVAHIANGLGNLELTTLQGSSQGITVQPIFDISPMLPDGLNMNWRNGTISGTPTEVLANTTFTVTVTALGMTTTGTFSLFITGEPGILAYNDIQASNQTVITTATPSFTNNSTSGTTTSWAISPSLPSGLSFGTTNGSIWGTPTLEQIKTSYTVWANNTAGSSSTTINITIGPAAPGPFEYSPENNTWTNNTEVYLAPQFINQTTGNGSTWQVADIYSGTLGSLNLTSVMHVLVGEVIYFGPDDGVNGIELWAYNTSNATSWLVEDIRQGSSSSNPGGKMMHVINGVLYFNAVATGGQELWKHDPSTGITSRVYDINTGSAGSSVGLRMSMVVGDVLYFSANDGSTGHELWAYNTSNSSNPWQVMDINSGSDSSNPGIHLEILVGDTLYFSADDGSTGHELWAHDTSNHSTWRVAEISSSGDGNPGRYMQILVGNTIYFSATDGSTGDELWAHNTSNHTTWQVADINSGSGHGLVEAHLAPVRIGDTLYFSANDGSTGYELWAHNANNTTTWQVADIKSGPASSDIGHLMQLLVGDTLYFSANDGNTGYELWAHDASNHTTYQVVEIRSGSLGSSPRNPTLVGDTLYFSATDGLNSWELWAYDTSNHSAWEVLDLRPGNQGSYPGSKFHLLVGDTLYFAADDGSTGYEFWAHRPSRIDYNTNTGGAVTTWAINASLPSGVSFGTNNGTIYGTPTELWTQTSYMVWANNSGGSSVAYLNITVVDEVPTLSYSPENLTLTKGNQSSDLPLNATLTGPGTITSWAINATLPSGLNFGTTNGTIWGIPTVLQTTATTYTIWANNSGGSTSATVNITIIDVAPGTFEYNPENNTFTNNTAESIAPTVTNSAGVITSWEINASLPSGLTIGATNGTIYGTPTELWTQKSYMVWANNSGGSSVGYLNITVVDEVPTLSYSPNPLTLRNNTVSSDLPLGPILTGSGEILSWAINASLPSGVFFGTNNGTIYGTATELWNQTTYMVWGNNTGGSAIVYLNITVVDQVPTLSYTPTTLVITKGSQSSDLPLNAALAGPGVITSWEISANLPTGLNFGTSNGTIWGTPTALQTTATTYTIWANNSGGSSSATVTITVNDVAPGDFEYNPENNTLTNNTDVYIAPNFVNTTTGNGSTWSTTPAGYQLTTSYDGDVPCLNQAYNGTIYASYNAKLHGYGIANNTLWLINNTIESVGCDTYFSWPSGTGYTQSVSHSYGTSLYFTGLDGSDRNLYGYGMENGTIWVESTADPGMWSMMVDDVMYFIGETGNSGYELHGHNLSNGTTWMLDDIFSGSGSITGPTLTNNWPVLVESTFVFGAVFTNGSTSRETWAHNISNGTSWRLSTNDASTHNAPVIGDVVYFTNNNGYGQWELHAYNASNETFWKVVAGPFGDPFEVDGILYGYVGSYSSYSSKLRAHNPANGTTWDAAVPGSLDPLNMGGTLYYAGSLTGTNNVQLWAYEPTNSTGWKVSDLTTPFGNGYGRVFIALGDVIYFTASNGTTSGLWAHSSSNHSTWFVSNPFSSINAAAVAVVNGTLYLGNSGMAGHQPASINYQTNTGGAVTSWAINASLPSGLTFSTTNGSIYGTPTELWTQTSYMVWANNSGGSSMTYLNITVIDQVPVLSYSPSALVLTINAQSTDLPLNATLTGPGAIVSWEINATLPAGLNFGTSNGTIWGIPTVMQTTALTYTIWANNTGGSTSATVTITINDAVPGPFEYEPENSTWLNNSLIHIAPDFINHTNGNGSTWLVADLTSGISGLGPGAYFEVVIGDTIYFDADDGTDGSELWAHNTSNHSTWQVADINSGSGDSSPGSNLYIVVDGVLYFSADDGLKGSELWAHNPANQSTWRVEDINSNFAFGSTPSALGQNPSLVGDTFYFSATDGNSGRELWAHDTSNHSTWRVTDLNTGSGNTNPGTLMQLVVGDSIYFNADDGLSGIEMWAHDTSNLSTWRVTNIQSGQGNADPGKHMAVVVEHTIYFDANDGVSSAELWAYNTLNMTVWQVVDIQSGGAGSYPGDYMSILVGDTLYFSATDGSTGQELWAHDTLNGSTWLVADIHSNGDSEPGQFMVHLVGDTIYFSADDGNIGEELWAHDTSNHSTWLVEDILGYNPLTFVNSASRPGEHFSMVIDDIIFFSACNGCSTGNELYAYNTSNYTTWLDQEIATGSASSTPGNGLNILVGDTLYLNAYTVASGRELWAYQPSSINIQTNTGGTVLSWAINASLPSGLSFGTNNGTIYGRPTELWTQTSYMVWANNSGGSTVAYLNLTVIDFLPILSYSPNDLLLTRGLQSSDLPLSATLTGVGEITSWEINGSLPAGLNFGTNNGTIWGIPSVLQTSSVTYTIWANNSGGSSFATVNITILEEIASIAYNASSATIVRGYDMANISVTKTGGNVVSWEISPSLPSGLSFDNGTIYGLPLVNMSATTYTVYANNSGGSASASLTLTINEPTPNIDYNPDNYTMSNGSSYTITPLLLDNMNNSSGAVIGLPSSWSISQSLPSGLNFGTNNGTIWGTPTVLVNTIWYNITATNANGTSTTSINITINDLVPTLSYFPENLTLVKGLASIDLPLNATLTGSGVITSWEINGSLPTGLNFGTNNGTIWGIPTVLQTTTTTYTIWANNSGGSTSATINITINDQVPLVSYSPENLTLLNNTVSSNLPISPTLTGPGVITSWAIHPDLPTGLTFETSNGTIWGTATQRFTTTQYTVWANNSGGSSVASLNITVLHEVPMFSYSSYNLTLVNNTAMSVMEPTSTGGEITLWKVDSMMPSGLTFNVANGTLSGTPIVVQNMTMYMIWGNNSGGSHAVYINITIYDPIATLDYNPENQTLTRAEAMTNMAPILSGIVDDWSIEPSLPSGLSFADGVISGTPTVNMTQTMYTIWANNTGGSASHTVNLTINEQIAVLDYNPENLTMVRGVSMTTLNPTLTGGNVETWAIHPAVPAGLSFAYGVLSGTPTVNMTQTVYTIWANNTGGPVSHTLNITIHEPIVTLDYNPENITMIRSAAMTTLHPSVLGGNVETWAIHPAIPAGLNFANGVLSGTPTVNMSLSVFTIYANTTGGSASHTLNITILEPSVILNYDPENQTMIRGVTMTAMVPTTTNGSVETWDINPSLPAGLNFNNGVISGTPTVNMSLQTFTVWANNTGGAAFHTVNLTINEPIVTLDYIPENQTLTRMTPMTPLHPIVTGGNVSVWGISPNVLPGLFFDNGLLYGTPTVNLTTPIMYTIYANTSGGVATHTVNITVLEPLVEFTFNPENQTFIRGEQNIVWEAIWSTNTSGIPQSWAIEPALPTGLNFNNGSITGSPTVNLTRTQYIVWANNSGGPAWASINITINEPEPMIDYNPNELVLTRNTTMATLHPNVTGGVIASWQIEPAPPVGLNFLDGVLSGTPTAIQNKTQYTIWANNSGGSMMAYLNITILDIVPEISYAPSNVTLTNDTSVLNMLPINLGGPPLTWQISPSLSAGLEFNQSTGEITGTPTEVMAMRLYTVTASNSGGSATTHVNITVLDQVPMIAYLPDEVVLLNDSSVLNLEPILTGGQVISWSITPNLSSGLVFNADNGTLSGIATQVQKRTMYSIVATNDVGSMTVHVNITVEDLLYNMSLGPLYLLNNTEMVTLEPESIVNGSTFELVPDLPEGLFFGANNGTVWGTPTEVMDLTNFTVYANSSLFNDVFVVQIGVLEDTDHDGMPDTLPEDADERRGLIEDLDDDDDGYADLTELDCISNPLSNASIPRDFDGDLICNELDDDIDGDGLTNSIETNTSVYMDANNTGTDPWNADTDGDGICDGPIAPALPEDYCEAGPDAFPNDASAYLDTDDDRMPDELWGESTTGLLEDLDDDNDNWTDLQEEDCGQTETKDALDMPVDSDGDGICDFNEVLQIIYGTGDFELLQGQRNVSLQPIITGMSVDIWKISPALPYGLLFGGDTMARTSNGNGTIYGVPLVPSNLTQYTVTGTNLLTGTQILTTFNLSIEEDYDQDGLPNNNTRFGLLEIDFDDDGDGFNDTFELECGGDPYNRSSVPKIESDGTCYVYRSYEKAPEKDKNPFKPICFPIIFLVLAFILVVPMILSRRQARVGVRAEHVSGTPAIQSGSGTQSDPFVLKAVVIPYNSKGKTEERIRCAEMSPGYEVNVREINVEINKKRFGAVQFGGVQDGTGVLKSNSDGLLMIQFTFDGTLEPSQYGMVYKSELILDEKTYFVWHVETKGKK